MTRYSSFHCVITAPNETGLTFEYEARFLLSPQKQFVPAILINHDDFDLNEDCYHLVLQNRLKYCDKATRELGANLNCNFDTRMTCITI